MHLYKRPRKRLLSWVLVLGIFFIGSFFLAEGSRRMQATARREQQELLEEAVNQAIVNCFCLEGRYPESIPYLMENYGLQIDFEQYLVSYEIFADNIKPRVKVIALRET